VYEDKCFEALTQTVRGLEVFPGMAAAVAILEAPAQVHRGGLLEGVTVQLRDQHGFPAMLAPPGVRSHLVRAAVACDAARLIAAAAQASSCAAARTFWR